mgnify:FL=1
MQKILLQIKDPKLAQDNLAETIYWFCQEDGFPQKLCIMKVSKSYLLINLEIALSG